MTSIAVIKARRDWRQGKELSPFELRLDDEHLARHYAEDVTFLLALIEGEQVAIDEHRLQAAADALMARRFDWQGTTGPGFSLQEPDWPQGQLARSLAATVIAALGGRTAVQAADTATEPSRPLSGHEEASHGQRVHQARAGERRRQGGPMEGYHTIKVEVEFTVPNGVNDEEAAEAIFDILCNEDLGEIDGRSVEFPYFSCDGYDLTYTTND